MSWNAIKSARLFLRCQRPRPGHRMGRRLAEPQRRRPRHTRCDRRRSCRRHRDSAGALVPRHVRKRLRMPLFRHWCTGFILNLLDGLAEAERSGLRHARHDGGLIVRWGQRARLERRLAIRVEPARTPTADSGWVGHARRRVAFIFNSCPADGFEQRLRDTP